MRFTGPDGFEADDDAARIDVDVVHGFLSTSYWAQSIAGSLKGYGASCWRPRTPTSCTGPMVSANPRIRAA